MESLEALYRVLTVGHHLDMMEEAKEEKRKDVTIVSINLNAYSNLLHFTTRALTG